MRQLTTQDFIAKSLKCYGSGKFDYSNTKYVSSKTELCLGCNTHNLEFIQRPDHHLQGHIGCRECIKEQTRQTTLERYGVENPMQVPEHKEKSRKTMMRKYGAEHGAQVHEIKEKQEKTMMKRYGAKYSAQVPEIKEKQEETMLKRHGFHNPLQVPRFKEKRNSTMIERYGTKHALQVPRFKEKQEKTYFLSSYAYKKYKTPKGRVILLQGYESFCYNDLINEGFAEEDIVTEKSKMPKIWYYSKGVKHRYYPDFYISSLGFFLEVKSAWTLLNSYDISLLKLEACIKHGYDAELRVYSSIGEAERVISFTE